MSSLLSIEDRAAGEFVRPWPPGPKTHPLRNLFRRRPDRLGFFTNSAREFGDFVPFKVGPWQYVLLNDPDAIRDVLINKAEKFTKAPPLRRASQTLGQGLLTSEGEFHRRQRRLAQPAFHPGRVAALADVMARAAVKSADEWRDGQHIDAHAEMMKLALRVVAETLFGSEVEGELDSISQAMDISVSRFTRAMMPWGPIVNALPLPSNFRFRRARKRLLATVDRFIAEHRAAGDSARQRGNLLSLLISATDEGRGMTDEQLRSECVTLFTAGHETTANALAFTWYLLGTHPPIEQRFHAELDSILNGRVPTATDLDNLPYTRAVFAESMRLYPPAWVVARQAAQPIELAGYRVPAGTIILMSQWVSHRDPRWWPDPERFNPDRWLDESSHAAAQRPRYAYFPFGGGPRSCIGEAFAWTEGLLVLAVLAQRWRLRLINPEPPALLPSITLRPAGGIPAMVERHSGVPLDKS
jgi:cytochrome P450